MRFPPEISHSFQTQLPVFKIQKVKKKKKTEVYSVNVAQSDVMQPHEYINILILQMCVGVDSQRFYD